MALSWFTAATRIYLQREPRSLVNCFDEIVAACLQSAAGDLAPSLGASLAPARRKTKRRTRISA